MAKILVDIDKPWHKSLPFSQGVIYQGRTLWTAGITARDAEGNVVGAGDMELQITTCFAALGDVLSAAGANWDDIIKIVMYTTDMDELGKHPDAWRQYFTGKPASTAVEVRRLALPEMLLEIEAVVALD